GNRRRPPRRRADHRHAERRDSCPKARSGQSPRAAAPAPKRTPFPAKLWRVQPMRPQTDAARVTKGSWLVDSIWRDERPWRGHIEQNGLFGPAPKNPPHPGSPLPPPKGLDKRKLLTRRPHTGNRPI